MATQIIEDEPTEEIWLGNGHQQTTANIKSDVLLAADEAKRTAGQRKVNMLWEITQSIIALSVSITTLYVSAQLALSGNDQTAFVLLSNTFFLVAGFYFGRTNHQRVGGISTGKEEGR